MWNVVLAQAQEAIQEAAPDGAAEVVQEAAGRQGSQGGGFQMFLPLIAIFAVFYLLIMRPQQKREKERRAMLAAVAKGDQVVTNGGICGTVVGLSEKSVVVRVSEDPPIKMEFLRGAISQVTDRDGQE